MEDKETEKKKKRLSRKGIKHWTHFEDEKLKKIIGNNIVKIKWNRVSEKMTNKTSEQCRKRWNIYLNPKSNTKWSKNEDDELIKMKEESNLTYGDMKKIFIKKSYISIRKRYKLLCDMKEQKWTVDEDNYILKVIKERYDELNDNKRNKNNVWENININGRNIRIILSRYDYLINII